MNKIVPSDFLAMVLKLPSKIPDKLPLRVAVRTALSLPITGKWFLSRHLRITAVN